jgi:hypothetical protein
LRFARPLTELSPRRSRDAITGVVAKVISGTTDYAMSPISAAAEPLAAVRGSTLRG